MTSTGLKYEGVYPLAFPLSNLAEGMIQNEMIEETAELMGKEIKTNVFHQYPYRWGKLRVNRLTLPPPSLSLVSFNKFFYRAIVGFFYIFGKNTGR